MAHLLWGLAVHKDKVKRLLWYFHYFDEALSESVSGEHISACRLAQFN